MKSSKFYTFTVPNGKSYKIPALVFKVGAVFAAAAICFGVYAAFAFVRYHARSRNLPSTVRTRQSTKNACRGFWMITKKCCAT